MDKNEMIELYKEEVEELTVLLKEEWTDLKEQLDDAGINTDEAFLVGYVEGEEGEEVGVLFTENKELIYFELTEDGLSIEKVTKEEIEGEFPQVSVLKEILS